MNITAETVQKLAEWIEGRESVHPDTVEAIHHLAEDLRNEEAAAAAPRVERLYRVVLTQHANYVVDVKATSPADAKQRAEDAAYAGLCHECSREIDLDPCGWEPIEDDPETVGDVKVRADMLTEEDLVRRQAPEASIVGVELVDESAEADAQLSKLSKNWPPGGPW